MIWWILSGAILFYFWGFYVEPNWFRIKRIRINLNKKLPRPLTILHLSDMHIAGKSNWFRRSFFQELSMMNPDLVFLTGDIIDASGGISEAVRLISGIRGRYGTYLILGNHDYCDYHFLDHCIYHLGLAKAGRYKNDVNRYITEMQRIGVTVLVNEYVKFDFRGTPVVIAGTDDPVTRLVDFDRALAGAESQALNVLLTHHLDSLMQLDEKKFGQVDLVISGHTHGGQVRIPGFGAIVTGSKLPRKYVDGLNDFHRITTFTSRGLGASRISFPRIACRPEAVIIEIGDSAAI